MSYVDAAAKDADDGFAKITRSLRHIGVTTLHLQGRAQMHEMQAKITHVEPKGVIARPVIDTQNNLVAMSRFCLQNLVPRTRDIMVQVECVAEAICRITGSEDTDLATGLEAIADELDRCGIILRGHARSSLRIAGMIRLSEQRLWGALTADLHRLEGTDGPIMQGCARIETLSMDLASTIDDMLDVPDGTPLAPRHSKCLGMICASARAGSSTMGPQIRPNTDGLDATTASCIQITHELAQEHAAMRRVMPDLSLALTIATAAGAQSLIANRLEDLFRILDRQINALARKYRRLAKNAALPRGRDKAMQQLQTDADNWRAAADGLAEPLALSVGNLAPPQLCALQKAKINRKESAATVD